MQVWPHQWRSHWRPWGERPLAHPLGKQKQLSQQKRPAVSCCTSLAMLGILNSSKTVTAKCLSYHEINFILPQLHTCCFISPIKRRKWACFSSSMQAFFKCNECSKSSPTSPRILEVLNIVVLPVPPIFLAWAFTIVSQPCIHHLFDQDEFNVTLEGIGFWEFIVQGASKRLSLFVVSQCPFWWLRHGQLLDDICVGQFAGSRAGGMLDPTWEQCCRCSCFAFHSSWLALPCRCSSLFSHSNHHWWSPAVAALLAQVAHWAWPFCSHSRQTQQSPH